jgi:hypothetical protein
VFALMLVVNIYGYYANVRFDKLPQRDWATEITSRYQPGDVVFYINHLLHFWWYTQEVASEGIFLVPDDSQPGAEFLLSEPASRALGLSFGTSSTLQARPYQRAFVLYGESVGTTPRQKATFSALQGRYPVLWQQTFVGDRPNIPPGSISLFDLEPQ